jgi:predicted lipoprotein
MGRTRRSTPLRVAGAAVVAALLVAMTLSTRFVTPEELASIGPEAFGPQQVADELFAEANETLPDAATPLPELLTGLEQDVTGTADRLEAVTPNETTYLFPVSGDATVVATQQQAVEITVDGVAAETPLSLAAGPAVNGTVLRDALGFRFGDASNQTTYQQVGDELKALLQDQLAQGAGGQDTTELAPGTKLAFTGIVTVTDTGVPQSPAKPVQVQPLTVEVDR